MLYQLVYFANLQDARDYRHEHGTGGWVFAEHVKGVFILFPPHMGPCACMRHPAVCGMCGDLIGCA